MTNNVSICQRILDHLQIPPMITVYIAIKLYSYSAYDDNKRQIFGLVVYGDSSTSAIHAAYNDDVRKAIGLSNLLFNKQGGL